MVRLVVRLGVPLLLVGLSACGGGTRTSVAVDTSSGATSTSGTDSSAGLGDPVWHQGELPNTTGQPMSGTVRMLFNGCWMVEINGQQRMVAFPERFVSRRDDPSVLEEPDGVTIVDGSEIDGFGQVFAVDQIPGADGSRFGNIVAFCQPDGREIAVFDSVEPAYDPASMELAQLVDMLDAASFTESWPCGHRFAVSTADQRFGLILDRLSDDAGTGDVSLPDESWAAVVIVGKQLFAQNCDDAVEQWESSPVVRASWPIVGGRFHVESPVTEELIGCGGNPVTTELTAAVVDTPAGPRELPTISLRNQAWGCFAG